MAPLGDEIRELRFKDGSPLAALDLSIETIRISEAISAPFEICVDLAGAAAPTDIDIKKLIGTDTSVQIGDQYWHGIVRSFGYLSAQPDGASNVHEYRAVIVPKLWRMTLNTRYRIFSDMTSADIVQAIFGEYGLSAPKNSSLLNGGQREYCTQFGETDLDLINRLIAEEGITYRLECDQQQAQVVLLKAPDSQKTPVTTDFISNLSFNSCLHSGAAELVDFDDGAFADANGTAKSKSAFAEKSSTTRAFGRFRFAKTGEGEHTLDKSFSNAASTALIEHLESSANGSICQFDCDPWLDKRSWNFRPGAQLTGIAAVENLSPSVKLVVVRREIVCSESYDSGSGAQMHVECAQAVDNFSPPRLPKPLPQGPFSAVVCQLKASDSDTAADPNRLLRVRFPWAEPQRDSCWLRVLQNYAGKGWGASFVPRVNQEVLVEFINGDIDRPVVMGALFNGKNNGPAYTSTQSGFKTESKKFNELRFDDKSGSEEVYLEAGKDFNYQVRNNQSGTVENDYTLTVNGKQDVKVKGDSTSAVQKTRKDTTTDAHTIESQKSIELKVAGCSITIDTQGITIKAMGNEIKLEAAGITVKGTTLKLNSDSTAQLKANASVSVEGSAMAEVKSGGMTTIKGSMTMIN
jgi:type VI secretion system secreted protein VgrG